MAKKEDEYEEEPFFEGLSKFIKENKDFLLELLGKWSKSSSRQFYAKIVLVGIVVVMSGLLAGFDKISGETLAGIIGVVLGYILGKGVL
ncbi:MAG TPA: hypothetical protein VJ249_00345 [Candidatus Bathyarchaeia archaeon]|nr:hypothetical protein [Candidatus Bathyarchaeia archaeon]